MKSVVIFCIGTEGYGISTVVLDLLGRIKGLRLLVLEKGSLYNAAVEKGYKVNVLDGIDVKGFYSISVPYLVRNIKSFWLYGKLLKKWCLQNNVELIHSHILPLHIIAGLASKKSSIRTVWHFHVICGKGKFSLLKKLAHKFVGCLLADCIIGVSEATAKPYKSIFRKHVRVIYNGINQPPVINLMELQNIRKKMKHEKCFILCWAGRIVTSKGLHLAIKAIKQIGNERVKLLVLGDNLDPANIDTGYRSFIINMINELELNNQVVFCGHVNNVMDFMAASDAVVHTRLDAEPCSMVIIEGLSAGKPVIATYTGGTGELIKNGYNGFTFKPDNENELARIILKLVYNKQLVRKLGEYAKKDAVVRFDIDRVAKEVKGVYSSLLNKR